MIGRALKNHRQRRAVIRRPDFDRGAVLNPFSLEIKSLRPHWRGGQWSHGSPPGWPKMFVTTFGRSSLIIGKLKKDCANQDKMSRNDFAFNCRSRGTNSTAENLSGGTSA